MHNNGVWHDPNDYPSKPATDEEFAKLADDGADEFEEELPGYLPDAGGVVFEANGPGANIRVYNGCQIIISDQQ